MVAVVTLVRPLPERMAGIGVAVLAVVWSLSAIMAHQREFLASGMPLGSALLTTMVGGTIAVAGVWFGIGAVIWAMGRLLGGKASFVRVLLAVSAAAPPLWVAGPMWMLALAGDGGRLVETMLALIGTVALCAFLGMLGVTIGSVQSFTFRRAFGCMGLTTLFCASYLSLHWQ
jgi:hypothetical protein